MKRKTFVKKMMGIGYSRNEANFVATVVKVCNFRHNRKRHLKKHPPI